MESDKEKTVSEWGGNRARSYKKGIVNELNGSDNPWINKILEYLPDRKPLKILDVGTGPGFFAISLSLMGHDLTAIDITPDMIETARENAGEFKAKVDFRVMDADNLRFDDDTFDLVVSRVVTWTIPDMFECYREWRRVLRPGGKVIVFDSNFRFAMFDDEQERRIRPVIRDYLLKENNLLYSGFAGNNFREEYVDGRPMVGTVRPQWDRNMLIKLCYKDIITIDDVLADNPPAIHYLFSPKFMIVATKPTVEEEHCQRILEHWQNNPACMSARTTMTLSSGCASEYIGRLKTYLDPGSDVLDLCCGCGMVSIPLSKEGYAVTGVDHSSRILEEAELCSSEHSGRARFVLADSSDLPFEDNSFDMVVCRNSLWTVYRLEQTIEEVRRVLKDGGMFIITDGDWFSDFSRFDAQYRKSELGNLRANLGLGGYPFIDEVFSGMELNKGDAFNVLQDILSASGFSIIDSVKDYVDPMIPEGFWDYCGKGFFLACRK